MPNLDWVLDAMKESGASNGPCIFVGGSSARGWGNATSDIDVYVLGGDRDAAWDFEQPDLPRVDVHELSQATVNALFERITWDSVRSGYDYVNSIKESEWVLLERFHHAHLLSGGDFLERYRERLAESAYQHMIIQVHFAAADSFVEDSLGQLAIADDDSAVLSGQSAYMRSLDGLLSAHHCFSWSPKWRARAMQDCSPGLVSYGDYWKIATMSELPTVGKRMWATKAIKSARDIMARVDVFTYEVAK